LAAENVTQGACASLLRDAIKRSFKAKLPLIAHVHDELVAECASSEAKQVAKALSRDMLAVSQWADGLPLAVETDTSPRFRK
jgi:DNA polymerase I-like protein with 3'-5' exonuclease and polymerase domains